MYVYVCMYMCVYIHTYIYTYTHTHTTDISYHTYNVLFNDAVNTFYYRLYGIIHMVKDHSDSERGNPLLSHGLLFLISSKGQLFTIFVF